MEPMNKITIEELQQDFTITPSVIEWMKNAHPDGATINELLMSKDVPYDLLYWLKNGRILNTDERKLWRAALSIDCDERALITHSHDVYDSDYIQRSEYITKSSFIFNSMDVFESDAVSHSSQIEKSSNIAASEFVFDSHNVISSKNVNDSTNVIKSNFIVKSANIYDASNIVDSEMIITNPNIQGGRSENLSNCFFVANCQNLENALFCSGISEGKYLLFNKQIPESQFQLILKQFLSLTKDYTPSFTKEWSNRSFPITAPAAKEITEFYTNLPNKILNWVKTLPGYNPLIFFLCTWIKN